MFGPSLLCETSVLSNGSFRQLLRPLLTSSMFRKTTKTSPGKINSLHCIAAASTYNRSKILFGLRDDPEKSGQVVLTHPQLDASYAVPVRQYIPLIAGQSRLLQI